MEGACFVKNKVGTPGVGVRFRAPVCKLVHMNLQPNWRAMVAGAVGAATVGVPIAVAALHGAFDRGAPGEGGWIYEYQSLIGGSLALVGAAIAIATVRYQVNADDWRAERVERQNYEAVSAAFTDILDSLNVVWRATALAIERKKAGLEWVAPSKLAWVTDENGLAELSELISHLALNRRPAFRRLLGAIRLCSGDEARDPELLDMHLSYMAGTAIEADPAFSTIFVGRQISEVRKLRKDAVLAGYEKYLGG